MFLLSVVLTNGGTAVSSAAEKPESAKTAAAPSQAPKQGFDAHEASVRYHFKDPDMDFTFGSLVLGATVNHGCEIGEAFRTAVNIKDGDAASWQAEWAKTARLVEARGERSLAAGHKVSAREQLQRASYYYRVALLAMLPDDPRLKEYARKSRSLLIKAGALFDPPLEYIEIPFEGTVLPGFFRKAAAGAKPAKTLIMIGGGETFAEDLFFYIAPQAFARGYNFMTVDLPGHGLLPLEGKYFRPDMYVPLKAVVDYALSRPEVDPQRLAVYGMSGGGGFVPQAAMHDPRIKAIVMNVWTPAPCSPPCRWSRQPRRKWRPGHPFIATPSKWSAGAGASPWISQPRSSRPMPALALIRPKSLFRSSSSSGRGSIRAPRSNGSNSSAWTTCPTPGRNWWSPRPAKGLPITASWKTAAS
jgi:pimeloyl-ACP methyl ester carboxylesterase